MAPHTGLLRDETLVLRWLFGYQDGVSLPSGVQQPQSPGKNPNGARFLSIDIDSLQEHDGVIQHLHVGISILDSKSSKWPVASTTRINLMATKKQRIESHHHIVGILNSPGAKLTNFYLENRNHYPYPISRIDFNYLPQRGI